VIVTQREFQQYCQYKFLYILFHKLSYKFPIHDVVRIRNNYYIFKILIHFKKYECRYNILYDVYIFFYYVGLETPISVDSYYHDINLTLYLDIERRKW